MSHIRFSVWLAIVAQIQVSNPRHPEWFDHLSSRRLEDDVRAFVLHAQERLSFCIEHEALAPIAILCLFNLCNDYGKSVFEVRI